MTAPSDASVAPDPQAAAPHAVASAAERRSPIKVKKIGHLVYEVSDVERSTKFWTEIMGFKISDRNEHGMVFLRTNADHHGIGLKPGKAKSRPDRKGGLAIEHIALEVEDVDALFAARAYLRTHGVPIVWEGRKGAGCNYGVTFLDPDGYEFELYCNMDQVGDDGRTRPPEQFIRADSLEDAVAKPVPKRW